MDNELFAQTLKRLRKSRGMNQEELAKALGVSRSAVGMYEAGKRSPDLDMLLKMCSVLEVDMRALAGFSVPIQSGGQRIPVVGFIACGSPTLAVENIVMHVHPMTKWFADFCLMCKGNSMEPRFQDGDIVAIRRQPTVENGQIAAVRIGDEATLKKVVIGENSVTLQPLNPEYDPIILTGAEMADMTIEGLAVGIIRSI